MYTQKEINKFKELLHLGHDKLYDYALAYVGSFYKDSHSAKDIMRMLELAIYFRDNCAISYCFLEIMEVIDYLLRDYSLDDLEAMDSHELILLVEGILCNVD